MAFLQPFSWLKRPLSRGLFAFWLLLALLPAVSAAPMAGVASAHPLASRAGEEILRAGGNAFDAAVAVSAVLAVVEPYSSGIGGGGFWLLHRASDGRQVMIDGRERAPLAANRDLYPGAGGEVIPGASIDGALAAGIPGQPAALAHLAERYGRLGLARDLQPAIRLAREGFEVDEIYRRLAGWRLAALRASPAASRQFLVNGQVPEKGVVIRQPELAETLGRLADQGAAGFYQGQTARLLVEGVKAAGGIWTLQDLADYRVVEREPIVAHYRGLRIVSAAPHSSGGVVLASMLNILSRYDLSGLSPASRVQRIVEAMRRAYRDRADYLGDPDFVDMPLRLLTSPDYAAGLARDIQPDRATPAPQASEPRPEGNDTTHFSIVDAEGNRVAATLSINYPFGSGLVPEGTGVLLNDEMDDFSARPGVPNVYGLVGGEANAIAPAKRMLSSMTPTFVEGTDQVAVLGTPGGSRIITMVLLGVLDMAEGNSPGSWVSLPRFHHQYLPDRIQFEPGAFSEAQQQTLKAMGYQLQPLDSPYGNMQSLLLIPSRGELQGASDPRGAGETSLFSLPGATTKIDK